MVAMMRSKKAIVTLLPKVLPLFAQMTVDEEEPEQREFEADEQLCWEIRAQPKGFDVLECLVGRPIRGHAYGDSGDHYDGRLTCRGGSANG